MSKAVKHSARFFAFLAAAMIVLAGVCLLGAGAGKAYADDYTYTVRVWAGNEGTVNGQQTYAEKTDVKYGEYVTLSKDFSVAVTDSKYYHKGFRVGGQDNQKEDGTTNLVNAVRVTEDMDFVVSYGVKGSQVDYTVNYVEYQTGTVLAPSATFQGNIGDKPVVAFEYVEGYRPLYRNITKTLGENAADNVITFEYVKLAAGEREDGTTTTSTTVTTTTTTTTGTTAGTAGAAGTTGGTTGTTGTASAGAASAESASAQSATAGSASASAASASTTPPATEEIRDEDATALTSGKDNGSSSDSGVGPMSKDDASTFPLIARIGIGALAVLAIATVAFLVMKRRRENDIYNNL